ncbi:MAG: ABC transporter ATP-binding protein [Acidimicrobiales bacterium]
MADVIEIEGLVKRYRRWPRGHTVAVDGLDLGVPKGGVFGLLGPNGAGKTTTLRCLLGLARPSAGRLRLLGADCAGELASVIGRVGTVPQSPAFFPAFSGRRNLLFLARTKGIGRRAVEVVLDQVGLASRARDPVRHYSFGMRQRLALAAGLLGDPEVLILDEPANGLDPGGRRAVSDLIRALGDQGTTVLVATHFLAEAQPVCDRVAIISRGRVLAAGSVAEVLAKGGASGLIVRVDRLDEGLRVLREAGVDAAKNETSLHVNLPPAQAATVTYHLAQRGLYVSELRPLEASLESVFIELTAPARPGGAR